MLGMIRRPGRIVGGAIRFGGVDLLRLSEDQMRTYRGRRIAMISAKSAHRAQSGHLGRASDIPTGGNPRGTIAGICSAARDANYSILSA